MRDNQFRIAVCSEKGGVGKTTLALNLGLALAQMGKPTLVVELDPQGCLASSVQRQPGEFAGLYEVVRGGASLATAVVKTKVPGLALLPVGAVPPLEAPAFHQELLSGRPLAAALELTAGIPLVLFDCPSGMGGATIGALKVATHVLVPVQAEPLALRSLELVMRAIAALRERENPALRLLGAVLMMFDRASDASMEVLRTSWRELDSRVLFDTVVPRHPAYLEASLLGVPVGFLAGGFHPEGRRFSMLAGEVLARLEGEVKDVGPTQSLL